MTPFRVVRGHGLSLPEADVDTDIIYPARFLLITERKGLGRYAFHDRRAAPGFPIAPGVERTPPFLIAGPNFGCGSSREQAPWALDGLGIRVIVADSFGEIFYSNCIKNGMLPLRLGSAAVSACHAAVSTGTRFVADLERQSFAIGDSDPIPFAIDPDRREALLNGWSEIARIRARHGEAIARFETTQRRTSPWLWQQESA